jgi:inorganic triphosphatase YgiF
MTGAEVSAAVLEEPQARPVPLRLRFSVAAAVFKDIAQWPALEPLLTAPRARRVQEIYYDTEKFTLTRHGLALHARALRRGAALVAEMGGQAIEVTAPDAEPELERLGTEMAGKIHDLAGDFPLLPVFSTDIKRLTRHARVDASEIELTFDSGFILSGAQKWPMREIGLELKSGDPAALYQFALALNSAYPVGLETEAKNQRGLRLTSFLPAEAVRSVSSLSGTPSMDDAMAALINSCMDHFTANWPAFTHGDAVNAVHQMRVAMRRLRSVLWLLQRAFPCPEFTAFRQEAKLVANAMGQARNWDVFIALLREGPSAAFPQEPGFDEVFAKSDTLRTHGYDAVRTLLAAPQTIRFVLALKAFVARRGWRNALAGDALPALSAPALNFARENLERLHRKLLKRGKHLVKLPPHERHLVRIQLKKLRYIADLFSGLFDRRGQVRAYNHAAARLQDQLGIMNDLTVANEMLAQLDINAPEAARAIGIIMGWTARSALADDKALEKCWAAFREAKLFT